MTTTAIVFNLYPFNEQLYLPAANLAQLDAGGRPMHLLQRATPATIGAYGIELTPLLERLFATIDMLTPKAIEAKFKPPKAKTAPALAALLENKDTKSSVELYIHRELDKWLADLERHRLPLTLDAERRTLAKDVLVAYGREELIPHLHFKRTDEGVTYRLQLGTESEQWTIREHNVVPLTNTEPAWLLVGYTLFRAPGINGNMVRPFLKKDVIQIPPDKVRVYFRQFIAKNAGRTDIEAEGFDVQTADQLHAVRLEAMENVLEKSWLLKPVFEYDGAEFIPGERRDRVTAVDFPDGSDEVVVRRILRDPAREAEQLERLRALGLEHEGRLLRLPGGGSLDSALAWLTEHRAELESHGFRVPPPEIDGRRVALSAGNLHIQSEIAGDWFDIQGRVEIGDFDVPFKALWPYLKSGDRFFSLPDDTFWLIPEEWFTRWSELAGALQPGPKDTLRLPKTLFTLLQGAALPEAPADFPLIDPDAVEYAPPSELKADLRPYQLRGVKWLVGHYQHGFGACLADDMGLGKTLQTIALLLHIKQNPPSAADRSPSGVRRQLDLFNAYQAEMQPLGALIVLPASLVFNWQRELQRFAPSLFVYNHTGPKRLRDARALAAHDVVLTTYHTARQDSDLLERIEWSVIVLDESQQIKNRDSELSRMAQALRGQTKISLSGTPIENSLSDLWSQMEFINPATLGKFSEFREQFLTPIEKRQDAQAKQRLFSRVRPFFMRRTKEEVAPDLPPLTEQVFYSEMTEAQRRRYEKVKSAVRNEILSLFDDPKTRLMALQALTRLRQLANHPRLLEPDSEDGSGKFDDVLAQWDTIRRAGHKVLFFSVFEKHLQLFREAFDAAGQAYAWLSGATAPDERRRAVERFQTDPGVSAFLMTLKAGGVGLNLTAADYVFVLDPWWNPAAEDQAIARAHRIGQERPVTALRFISRDTIEEKIRVLQERKRGLGQGLFETDSDMPVLSREELEGLLG